MVDLIIIGFGKIGKQRFKAAKKYGISESNIIVFDPYILSDPSPSVQYAAKLEDLYNHCPAKVIISTPHDLSRDLSTLFLSKNCQVLLDKPMGRNFQEATRIYNSTSSENLSIGFNYRFMPGIMLIKKMLNSGELGKLSRIKLELGHGGSPGDQNSWKLDLERCGGGALLDPGIHLIDLLLYFWPEYENEFKIMSATSWRGFWNTGIEETASILGMMGKTPFSLDLSLVAWKTRFKIEIIGTDGYVELSGRGRTDGPQKVLYGKRWAWKDRELSQQEYEVEKIFDAGDFSIESETIDWLKGNKTVADSQSGLRAMKLYQDMKMAMDK